MRKSSFVLAATGLLVAAAALPASAQTTDSTTVTFTITAGALTITVPETVDLGTVQQGAATEIAGQLGSVQVSDLRGLLGGTWTTTVTSTDFTTGGATTPETIPNENVDYDPGTLTSTTGDATFTPGTPGALGTTLTAVTATAINGPNTAAWNPTITITIPPTAVSGDYTGTITHSVA